MPPQCMVGTSGAFNTLMALEDRSAQWRDPRVADAFKRQVLRARWRLDGRLSKGRSLQTLKGMHPDRFRIWVWRAS